MKRYTLLGPGWESSQFHDSADMREDPEGEYVLWADYERLRRYAQHLPACPAIAATDGPFAPYPCRCGLHPQSAEDEARRSAEIEAAGKAGYPRVITRVMTDGISTKDGCA